MFVWTDSTARRRQFSICHASFHRLSTVHIPYPASLLCAAMGQQCPLPGRKALIVPGHRARVPPHSLPSHASLSTLCGSAYASWMTHLPKKLKPWYYYCRFHWLAV